MASRGLRREAPHKAWLWAAMESLFCGEATCPQHAHRATARLAAWGNVCRDRTGRIICGRDSRLGWRYRHVGRRVCGPPYAKADLPPMSPKVKFIALTVGGGHGVAITEDRTLVQWGGTASGTPPEPAGRTFFEVRARSSHSIARDDMGQLYGWGSGLFAPGSTVLVDPLGSLSEPAAAGTGGIPDRFPQSRRGPPRSGAESGRRQREWLGIGWRPRVPGAPKGVKFSAIAAGRNFSIGLDRKASSITGEQPANDHGCIRAPGVDTRNLCLQVTSRRLARRRCTQRPCGGNSCVGADRIQVALREPFRGETTFARVP